MFIDHFSKLIIQYTYSPLLFELGRISFPLFAFLLVYNYLFNTSSKIKYLKRLFVFALISQPFFSFAFQTYTLNIFFVLFFGLLCIYFIEKSNECKNKLYFLYIFLILITFSFFVDYKPFGILLIISLYFVFEYKKYLYWFIFLILILLSNHYIILHINFGFIGLILAIILFNIILYFVIYKNKVEVPRFNKWFFYSFYPLHLVFILIIQFLVVNYV